jgi:hypothetical protein
MRCCAIGQSRQKEKPRAGGALEQEFLVIIDIDTEQIALGLE